MGSMGSFRHYRHQRNAGLRCQKRQKTLDWSRWLPLITLKPRYRGLFDTEIVAELFLRPPAICPEFFDFVTSHVVIQPDIHWLIRNVFLRVNTICIR